ncbi:hypothetical protein HMPREF1982_03007 [Clostridiales bacterium oral taxon 876 str. F0540]|nr:hypothetical protein HMPREF1982_03007 [Clostridiales bacterium oral taxon 876 str. F0540]
MLSLIIFVLALLLTLIILSVYLYSNWSGDFFRALLFLEGKI